MNPILSWTLAILFLIIISIVDFREVYLYITSPSPPPVSIPVNLFVDIKRGYDALMDTTLLDNAQYVASIGASLDESYIQYCNQQLDSMSSYESATLHVKALVTLMQQMNVFYATMEETWRNIKTYLEIEENDEVVVMKYRLQLLAIRMQMEMNGKGFPWIINGKYERHSISSLYRHMKHYGREKTLVKDEEVLSVDIRKFEKTIEHTLEVWHHYVYYSAMAAFIVLSIVAFVLLFATSGNVSENSVFKVFYFLCVVLLVLLSIIMFVIRLYKSANDSSITWFGMVSQVVIIALYIMFSPSWNAVRTTSS